MGLRRFHCGMGWLWRLVLRRFALTLRSSGDRRFVGAPVQRSLAPRWFRTGCTGRLRRFGSVIAFPLFVAEPRPNALPRITLGAARIHIHGWSGFSLFRTIGFRDRRHARHQSGAIPWWGVLRSIRRHALALRTAASSALAHHHGGLLFLGTRTFRTRQRSSCMRRGGARGSARHKRDVGMAGGGRLQRIRRARRARTQAGRRITN